MTKCGTAAQHIISFSTFDLDVPIAPKLTARFARRLGNSEVLMTYMYSKIDAAASRCVLFLQMVGSFGSVLLLASVTVTVTLIVCRVHLDS